jgi:hypothetical protein
VIDGVFRRQFRVPLARDLGADMRALIAGELPKYQALGARYVVLPCWAKAAASNARRRSWPRWATDGPFGLVAALEPMGHVRREAGWRKPRACSAHRG